MDIRRALEGAKGSLGSGYDAATERLLERLGLEHKRSTMEIVLPAIGIFAAGVTVGALLGVMFAPKRGEDLRTDVRHRLEDLRERGVQRYDEIRHREGIEAEAEA